MPPTRTEPSPQRTDDAGGSTTEVGVAAEVGPCLSEDLVLALAVGDATDRERTTIEVHLDSCDACQMLVAAVARDFDSGVSPAPSSAKLLPGTLIANRYRVERFVARGGMGEVYQAYDQVLEERIALKTLRPISADDPKAALRLKVEVQLARRVSHPHTCRIYDFSEWTMPEGNTLQFLTMELIQGATLGSKLRREGRRSPEDVSLLAEQLLSGLDAVHRMGIVHRDFKSDNVMLHDTSPLGLASHAVIMDFGLARGLADRRARLTSNSRALVGSAAYMAPEQVLGEELTPAADVYAFGVVLFELLTGTLPFEGDSPVAIAVQRLHKPAPRPSQVVRGLPAEWDELVAACLARQVEARLPNAGAALRRLLAFRSGSVASVSTAVVAPAARRLRGGALAALALALVGWGGLNAWRHTEELRQVAAQQVARPLEARPLEARPLEARPLETQPLEIQPPGEAPREAEPSPAPAPAVTAAPAAAPSVLVPAKPRATSRRNEPGVTTPSETREAATDTEQKPAQQKPAQRETEQQETEPAAAAPAASEPVQQRPSADPRDGFRW